MTDLTDKQKKFVAEYLTDLNATQAAIRSGYSVDSAGSIGSENLQKPEIMAALAEGRKKLMERIEVTQERVTTELARLGFLDIRKAFDDEGNLRPIHEIDDDTAAAIAGIETEQLFEGRGEARQNIGRLHKIKLSDKKGALDSLARILGMFKDTPAGMSLLGADGKVIGSDGKLTIEMVEAPTPASTDANPDT